MQDQPSLKTRLDQLEGIVGNALAGVARDAACLACETHGLIAFYGVEGIPTQTTVLLDTREAALDFPTGDLLLGFCISCGFIQNVLFDPELIDYSLPTEESQAFSPLFTEYASRLADRLVDQHNLRGGTVLEVGSGKGEFLALLAERGIGKGIGVDPGFLPDRGPDMYSSLEFRREFYGPRHTEMTGDLVVARHLLEHIPDVHDFLKLLAASTAATDGGALFLEVPDTGRILDEGAFWDVYYEHCSYFTPDSIRFALSCAGLSVGSVELGFDDQYILVWARPESSATELRAEKDGQIEPIAQQVLLFAEKGASAIGRWHGRISDQLELGHEVVIWGASSKAVSFLSAIAITDITVVDINPYKQGKWLPGLAVEVQPPSALADSSPSLVIPMNPVYVDEIGEDLVRMGISATLEPVF